MNDAGYDRDDVAGIEWRGNAGGSEFRQLGGEH